MENLKQDVSSQNETIKRLEEQLNLLDIKYTEALDKIQTLELSSTNLNKENQYLKQINNEVTKTIYIILFYFIYIVYYVCVYILYI